MKPSLALNYSVNLAGIFPSSGGGGATPFPITAQLNLYAGNYNFNNSPAAGGQLMSINQNQALFSLLGTNYGGNGVNTFALPDLRGRTPIGAGQGPGIANVNLGDMPGHEQTVLTLGQLPAHDHTLPGGGFTDITGNSQPFDNMEPSTTLNYMIAINGIFPSRDGSNVSNFPFLGELSLFAGSFAPNGWMFAQGQLLPISQYTALFAILGTTYGGNGLSNFALPDLRGRTIVGAGQGPGLPDWVLGQQDGASSIVLSVSQLPDHNHTLPIPEPSGISLILLGAASFAVFGWRQRRCAR
jgi:microcystin-dependent protein